MIFESFGGLLDAVDAGFGGSINIVERGKSFLVLFLSIGGGIRVEGDAAGEALVDLGGDFHDDVRNDL